MKSKLQRAFSHSSKTEKVSSYYPHSLLWQDELLDFVFWCRQLIALAFGMTAGFLALTGIYVILGFFVALFLVSWLYYSKVLNINEEDFGQNELFMEGVGNAFGLFLVSG